MEPNGTHGSMSRTLSRPSLSKNMNDMLVECQPILPPHRRRRCCRSLQMYLLAAAQAVRERLQLLTLPLLLIQQMLLRPAVEVDRVKLQGLMGGDVPSSRSEGSLYFAKLYLLGLVSCPDSLPMYVSLTRSLAFLFEGGRLLGIGFFGLAPAWQA